MLMKSTMQLQELPLNVSARPVCDKGFVPGSDVCGEGGEEVLSDVKSWERTRDLLAVGESGEERERAKDICHRNSANRLSIHFCWNGSN